MTLFYGRFIAFKFPPPLVPFWEQNKYKTHLFVSQQKHSF